jgi:hypothetical protein
MAVSSAALRTATGDRQALAGRYGLLDPARRVLACEAPRSNGRTAVLTRDADGTAPGVRRAWAAALTGFALLACIALGQVLLAEPEAIVSSHKGDTARYIYWARHFGAQEMRQGNLPLWNPHLFSGTPFLGSFQTAVLYPLAAFGLILPTGTALGLEFGLHLFLAGAFTFAWTRGLGLGPMGAFYAGAVLMLGAPFLLRVVAGQLTVIDALAWCPLLLLAIDRICRRPRLGACLVGTLATSMMILAGHPPSVLSTGLVAALYAATRWPQSPERTRAAALLGVVAFAPLLLAGVQLWTGLEAALESVRQGGVSYEYATSFSFPPEALVTLVAPSFFGSPELYWGRWFYWDASAFLGITTLALAALGVRGADRNTRRVLIGLALLLLLLSLGRYTPVYRLLYHGVPGFGHARAPSKFLFHAGLFTAALAGIGVDRLLRDRRGVAVLAWLALFLGIGLGLLAPLLRAEAHNPLRLVEGLAGARTPTALEFVGWTEMAYASVAVAAVSCLVLFALLRQVRVRGRQRPVRLAIVFVGILELVLFAQREFRSFVPESGERLGRIQRGIGEARTMNAGPAKNISLLTRGYDAWGYDPLMLRRYVEFMSYTQGRDPIALDNVDRREPYRGHRLLAMVRCRALLSPDHIVELESPLPRFVLVRSYEVHREPAAILAALDRPDFDLRRSVVLEENPVPAPRPGPARGSVRRIDESTDHLRLDVELSEPAILLATDAYSEGWRVSGLPGSPQAAYRILPANLTLRAVPLSAGLHRLHFEYAPLGYRVGRWASLTSGAVFLALASWAVARRRATRVP